MIYALPLWLRRLLAVSLLLTILGLTGLFTVVPFVNQLATMRQQLAEERQVYGSFLAVTQATAGQGTRSLKPVGAHAALPSGGLFIDGESDSIRLASLQSQVVDILAGQGIKPRTARMLQSSERQTLKLVGVQLQMTATIEQLQKVLVQIEAHRPILLVDSLHLTPTNAINSEDDRGLLEARIDVRAIVAKSPAGPPAADTAVKVP
jgi:Type II secretion system (T2SS), protein M subtype b